MKTELLMLKDSSREDAARKTAGVLLRGGICIIPTDTLYGLVTLDHFPESMRRIYDIKKRPSSKPFVRLIGSLEALGSYTDQKLPPSLSRYWPGPLTILFRDPKGGGVAVRFPDDLFLDLVFRLIGNRGIVAPSANISGEADIGDCAVLIETFDGQVDLIVCREGGLKREAASTIVDITVQPWRVVRQGTVVVDIADL
jgi:L-threonylcarbamoyladenylate synthase